MRLPLRPPPELGISMTPLIDIVFQLLIFFLVTNHLAQRETHLDLALPRAASGSRPPESSSPHWIINIQPGGALSLSGRTITLGELQQRFAERPGGSPREVRIRSDRSVPYKLVEPVLTACFRANIRQVSFAVYKEEE